MTAIYQGNETETFFDQRPTHARMSNAEFDARRAEEIAWRAYDDTLEIVLATDHPTREDYENLDHAKLLAEQASHTLSLILHAKHHQAETSEIEYEFPL